MTTKAMKLDDGSVLDVFRLRLKGWTLDRLAAKFGVHAMYIQMVLKGKSRRSAHPSHPVRLACVAAELDKMKSYQCHVGELRGGGYDAAIADYKRGFSLRAAAAMHGMHWTALGKEMTRRRIRRRPVGKPSKFCHLDG